MLASTLSPPTIEAPQPEVEHAPNVLEQLTDEEVRVLRFCLAWTIAHFDTGSEETAPTSALLPPLLLRTMRTARDILVKLDRRLPPPLKREEGALGAWEVIGPDMVYEGEGEQHHPEKGDGQVHDRPATAAPWPSSEASPVP